MNSRDGNERQPVVIGQTLPCFPDGWGKEGRLASEGSYVVAASIALLSDLVVQKGKTLRLSGNPDRSERFVLCGGEDRARIYVEGDVLLENLSVHNMDGIFIGRNARATFLNCVFNGTGRDGLAATNVRCELRAKLAFSGCSFMSDFVAPQFIPSSVGMAYLANMNSLRKDAQARGRKTVVVPARDNYAASDKLPLPGRHHELARLKSIKSEYEQVSRNKAMRKKAALRKDGARRQVSVSNRNIERMYNEFDNEAADRQGMQVYLRERSEVKAREQRKRRQQKKRSQVSPEEAVGSKGGTLGGGGTMEPHLGRERSMVKAVDVDHEEIRHRATKDYRMAHRNIELEKRLIKEKHVENTEKRKASRRLKRRLSANKSKDLEDQISKAKEKVLQSKMKLMALKRRPSVSKLATALLPADKIGESKAFGTPMM
jgi:hypothetical protein